MNSRTSVRHANTSAAQPETKYAPTPFTRMTRTLLQRSCACGGGDKSGDCAECSRKKAGLNRSADRSGASPDAAPPLVGEVLRESGHPLDASARAFMEPRFGHDFSHVRIHADERAAESARDVGALAYTVGHDVVFGNGQYEPETTRGRRLLAHELTHVVQQRNASPHAGVQAQAFEVGQPHSPAEREADDVASRVMSERPAGLISGAHWASVQRQDAGSGGSGGSSGGSGGHEGSGGGGGSEGGGGGGGTGGGGGAGGGSSAPPHITMINVDMNTPQSVTLDWSDGTHTPGIECSTGRGKCCPRPCDPPLNAVGESNCTPDGTFTVDSKNPRTGSGLNNFVSFLAARQIGLHEYSPVDGTPLSHGCVRLHTADSLTVFNGSVPNTTQVSVTGTAVPNCPRPGVRTCRTTRGGSGGRRSSLDGEDTGETALAMDEGDGSTGDTDPPMS